MNKSLLSATVLLASAVLLSACAGQNPMLEEPMLVSDVSGFWGGLVHGFFIPVSFVASIITDAISVYEVHNTGGGYDAGFVLGTMLSWRAVAGILRHIDSQIP